MKCFRFKKKSSNNKNIDSNGWIFNFLSKKNIGFFSLKTPIVKEVTYSKGPSVRYQRHRVLGIGIVNASNEFVGLAFFDPHIRILIFLIILFGVSYVSLSIATGLIFGSLFYLLILFLSLEEDDRLLSKCKLIFENES